MCQYQCDMLPQFHRSTTIYLTSDDRNGGNRDSISSDRACVRSESPSITKRTHPFYKFTTEDHEDMLIDSYLTPFKSVDHSVGCWLQFQQNFKFLFGSLFVDFDRLPPATFFSILFTDSLTPWPTGTSNYLIGDIQHLF